MPIRGELVRIATVINKLVDLDGWDEDQEQELFELSVSTCLEVICRGLAPPHYDMLHTSTGGLSDLGNKRMLSWHGTPVGRVGACRAPSHVTLAQGCSARDPWPC